MLSAFLSLPIALIWGLGWGFGAMPIVAWSMIIGKELHDKHIKNPATGFDLVDIKIGGLGWFIGWIAAGGAVCAYMVFGKFFNKLK